MFRRRRVPWLVLLLALVIGGIAAAYILTRDDASSAAKTRVPDVVGLSTGLAVQRLGQRGYPAIVQSRVSAGARLGTVLSQAPPAGTELDRSKQVTVVVARGPSTVDVPNVVGLSSDQAFVRLLAAKLKGRTEQIPSAQPKGRIVQQAPPGGSQLRQGSTVTLLVSKGARLVTVPSVTGLTQASATATLSRLGFRLSVSRVAGTQPKGTVIAQVPAGGSRAQRRSIVGINVSTGPSTTGPIAGGVAVPKVVGLSQRNAVARIERAGLKVDSYPVASTRPQGIVVSQLPVGGTRIASRSQVRINVSLGPGRRRQRAVPDVVGQNEKVAKRTLINAGFTVQTVDRPVTDPGEQALVLEQRPAGGNRALAGSQVVIYVGRIPSPSD